jgi:hypothetical protein
LADGIEASLDKKGDLADRFAFLALDKAATNTTTKRIPDPRDIPKPKR